jgi:hypothetical protein
MKGGGLTIEKVFQWYVFFVFVLFQKEKLLEIRRKLLSKEIILY